MLNNEFFNCQNKDTYPPFKNGLYMEEYFYDKCQNTHYNFKRKYIPVKWTNFQIEEWFEYKKQEMQELLDEWILENPSENGYFTVIQHDDGPSLKLPNDTVVYGACSGDIAIPLIYQDIKNTLINTPKKTFSEKSILCSFVGNMTANHIEPNVREVLKCVLSSKQNFLFYDSGGWSSSVNLYLQQNFINMTLDSKFALAPRGYGRSSFRFFECFQLGCIPIYFWNDIEWLPFKDLIDYKRLCISMHISQVDDLEKILNSITEDDYNKMLEYYEEIKHLFELEGMSNKIIKENVY
jgi:hypothetical protein